MQKISSIMLVSFITNLCLSIIKIITGLIFTSSALIADGIHSFSDLVTDVVAIIGDHISRKPADSKHPFGHGKLEYLTSLAIGIIILFLGFSVISGSFSREIVIPSLLVSIVSFFTIITKFILSGFLISKGKKLKNSILVASGKESSTDCLSSIVVLISSILMQFSGKIEFLKYADMVATIIVGIFVVKVGFDILKNNVSILIGECETDDEVLDNLKNNIMKEEYVKKIDNLYLFKYGSYYKLIFEVTIDGNLSFKKAHNLMHILENKIKEDNSKIKYITVHANPDE